MIRQLRILLCGVLLSTAGTSAVVAQPVPSLSGVTPVYLKQGESTEVTLAGGNVGNATGVVVASPRGVEASLIKAAKQGEPNRLKITADPAAQLGGREVRVVTPLGVTPPLAVTVGQYPFIADKEPNNGPESAQPVQLPASLGGRIDVPGDADAFRFDAKKGQKLIFDVFAGRLNSALDPVVTIHDSTGRELPHTDQFHGGDPTVIFDVPADGAYVVQIRDLQYRGGGDYGYRIDAGQIPYVASLVPMTGRRGQKVDLTFLGHNLDGGGEKLTLDLADAETGPMPVRVKTSRGWSNEVLFNVTDTMPATEKEPNDEPAQATPVQVPAEVTGVLDRQNDEDYFRFSIKTKQAVTIALAARSIGSPVDGLLTLKTAKNELIDQTNGSTESEPRISRSLEPGEYLLSVRDLAYAGGPDYAYRLSLSTGTSQPDFTVRFLPDAPRVARGGSAKVWCEIVRANGYKGDVAVSIEGLPQGVTVGQVVMQEKTSGIFTISAAQDAVLGSAPFRLQAVGTVSGREITRTGEPELNSRIVQQAYLTVLDAAPVSVDAISAVKPEQVKDYAKQVADLYAKLNSPSPQLDAAQSEWEKKSGQVVAWKALDFEKTTATSGTMLNKQPDGSILAAGKIPDSDTYTLQAKTDLKSITAIRLEVVPDATLPGSGPGRSATGNFVLSRFALTAAPSADPAKSQPVAIKSAQATFEQPKYGVAGAIDNDPASGWAIMGGTGKPQSAVFLLKAPLVIEGGSTLTFTLDQLFGQQHAIGRFRISVTDDPQAATKAGAAAPLPQQISDLLKLPVDKRTPEQKTEIANYYRSIAPELAADRSRLEGLRNGIGPYAEIARLEQLLNSSNAVLDEEQRDWEKTALTGGWSVADVGPLKSSNGSVLIKEKDGSIAATGPSPATDVYSVILATPLKEVSAIRIEALPDERFPESGPGRAGSGNFVITRLGVTASAKSADGKATPPAPVELRTAKATFEQKGWPAIGALDDRDDTGWAVFPQAGRPASAVFIPKSPITGGEAGVVLGLNIEQKSQFPQHTLGRFRIWVTSAGNPAAEVPLTPPDIAAILKTAADKRTDDQRAQLATYFRSITPSLVPVRERLAELKSRVPQLPLTTPKNKTFAIPVPIARQAGFSGDVVVTLEGFASGRDPQTRLPNAITKSLAVTPLTLTGADSFGRLQVKVNGNSEVGTRMVVLKTETKVGNDTVVQYSPAFPLTVTEK